MIFAIKPAKLHSSIFILHRTLKHIALVFFLITFALPLYSQSIFFKWAKQLGGTADAEGRSIAVDDVGNVYTTGPFFGTVDFDPGPAVFNLISGGEQDIFISKLDPLGKFIWAEVMAATIFTSAKPLTRAQN